MRVSNDCGKVCRFFCTVSSAPLIVLLAALTLFACDNGVDTNKFIPRNYQTLDPKEIEGKYKGTNDSYMDGKPYGPYTEQIEITYSTITERWTLRSSKTTYGDMPLDMSYFFEDLNITKNPDGTISLSTEKGKEGRVIAYNKGDKRGKATEIKVLLPKAQCKIYKEKGVIHADFTVDFDTNDLKKDIVKDMIPEGTHETLRSVIKTQKIK